MWSVRGQGHGAFELNIAQMVKYRADITLDMKYEVAYGLSISIFTFDLGPF